MGEMLILLFRRRFVLKSNFFIAFVLAFSIVQGQNNAFLRLSFPGFSGSKIQITQNTFLFSKNSNQQVELDSNGVQLLKLEGSDLAVYVEVFSPDLSISKEVYVPINDTIDLHFDKTKSTFTLSNDVFNRNKRIAELNSLIDDELNRFYKSRRLFSDKKRLVSISDSARLAALESTDSYFKQWALFICSDLDIASGLLSQVDLHKRSFSNEASAPENPAWQRAFLAIFDNDLLVRIQGKNSTRYKGAIQKQQLDSLVNLFQRDTFISNPQFRDWLILYDLSQISTIRELRLEDVYSLLLQFIRKPNINPIVKNEAERLSKRWSSQIKGKQFPDLQFWCFNSESNFSLYEMKGKPIYVALLPDYSMNSQLVIKQFQALHSKYGKEMRFLAIVNDVTKKDQVSLLKNNPDIITGSMESCKVKLDAIFPELNRIQFFILDRYGNVFQNPAEGPETGVEDAFLNLIKMK
jgi:hypothetical protein